MNLYKFTGVIVAFNHYGDRILYKYPAVIYAENANVAREKGRESVGGRYDSFRKFWSHRFDIEKIEEVPPNDRDQVPAPEEG
jgi:hypothetical protein